MGAGKSVMAGSRTRISDVESNSNSNSDTTESRFAKYKYKTRKKTSDKGARMYKFRSGVSELETKRRGKLRMRLKQDRRR